MQEKNVKIVVFGCRLNIFEAEKIRIIAEKIVSKPTIIVNTCAVTNMAVKQARQAVHKLSAENPTHDIIVAGCAATSSPESFSDIPNVVKVLGNREKFNPESYKSNNKIESKPISLTESLPLELEDSLYVENFEKLTKGFVQIQQGCNNCCTFCLVRQLRGKNVCFPYEHIKRQTEMLIANGYSEIVLTGVDIAGYKDSDGDLIELVKKLLRDVPNIKRLMLSSLDPAFNLTGLVDLIDKDERLMPHIHLSMQSGCDKILKLMGRRHLTQNARDLMTYAKKSKRPITFGWDMICGFPNETESDFETTMDLVKELKPTHLHVFPYSPRPNTIAAKMPNQNPRKVSKARANRMIEEGKTNLHEYMNNMIGKEVRVLLESKNTGYTDDYIQTKIQGKYEKGTFISGIISGIEKATDKLLIKKP